MLLKYELMGSFTGCQRFHTKIRSKYFRTAVKKTSVFRTIFFACYPPLILAFNTRTQTGCVTAQALSKHSQMIFVTTNFNTSWTKSPLKISVSVSHAFYGPKWVSGCHVCVCVGVCSMCACVSAWEEEAVLTSTGACASGEVSTHETTCKMK